MGKELFRNDPRGFALELADLGEIDTRNLLISALNWMSTDEVRDMLDANELSPRFWDEDEENEDEDELV